MALNSKNRKNRRNRRNKEVKDNKMLDYMISIWVLEINKIQIILDKNKQKDIKLKTIVFNTKIILQILIK
jgi:hypothetical protein